jgi:hypothetical protein
MAANNEITLETKRCIFVADHIYFSNYYLKSKISEVTGPVNKIMFDTTEFMNKTMIQDNTKRTVQNTVVITQPDLSNLNESLYSKVNISDNTIDIDVAESNILELKIENKSIFKDNEQIKQFLKYDGWWCPVAQQIEFDDKDGTKEAKLVEPNILPVAQRIAAASNARSQEQAQVNQQVADALKGANNVTTDDDPDQPNPQQIQATTQGSGGSKQTRSTRNHKNRKSKKN